MGMLDGLVGQLVRQAAGSAFDKQGGLGSILGGLIRGHTAPAANPASTASPSVAGSAGSAGLLMALLPVILSWVQQQGGLEKVLASLQGKGLGAQAQSWISTQQNQPIQPEQIESVFGAAQVDQFAAQVGQDRGAVLSGLASLLPQVIDQLTPKGDASTAQEANQEISAVLGQIAALMRR